MLYEVVVETPLVPFLGATVLAFYITARLGRRLAALIAIPFGPAIGSLVFLLLHGTTTLAEPPRNLAALVAALTLHALPVAPATLMIGRLTPTVATCILSIVLLLLGFLLPFTIMLFLCFVAGHCS